MATVGGGIFAVLIVLTYLYASKPHMGLLASGLSGAEQGAIIQELQKQGVPYEMDTAGISVPNEKIAELRANLMMKGLMKAGQSSGDDDYAKLNNFSTPKVERERLRAIAENNLAQNIEELDGVASAQVHLALGDDSPFVSDNKGSTASITVFEKTPGSITKDQAHGIAMLVASAVPNLPPSGVTVLDGSGNMLVDPSGDATASGQVGTKLATERLEAKRREREIQAKLDQAFGPGTTIATVNLEIDFKGEKYSETVNTPTAPLSTTESTETMTGSATPGLVGGLAGTASNVAAPAATTGVATGGQGYQNKTKTAENLIDSKTTEGEDPGGKLKSMAISVLINDKVDKASVQDFLKNYLGPKAADTANFTANVTQTKFDTSAEKAAKDAASAAASRDRMQQIFSLLPIVALIGVALLVIKTVGKFAKTQTLVLATPDGKMIPLPANGLNLSPEAIQQSGGSLQLTAGAGANRAATGTTPAIARQPRTPGEPEQDDMEIDSIKRKINVPLEQIKKMSDERPEVVAMLIKSWLMEERR